MSKPEMKVLLVDDSPADLKILELFARKTGLETEAFTDPKLALAAAMAQPLPCLIISDISMPAMDGFEILKQLKSSPNGSRVVFISGQQEMEYPIRAMRLGALDYLTKPLDYDLFEARITKAWENLQAQHELSHVRQQIFSGHSFESFVGRSEAIRRIFEMIMKVSEYDSTVLITGESGVGKEKVARSIHERSRRAEEEFVAVNCASLPENLVESELFGHVRGAFTGADKDTPGLFAVAHKGTLFLDEIGELPPHVQAKLLRVLQEKEIRPVGGKKTQKVDVRVICATHRDLEALVADRKFREDLYFRLNVIPISIPPLRERPEDLDVLIPHVLGKLNEAMGLGKTISAAGQAYLRTYPFPGNVRELENMLERAYIFSGGREIQPGDLNPVRPRPAGAEIFNLGGELPTLREIELGYIREVLRRTQTKEEAAQILGIGRKTLYRKEFEVSELFGGTPPAGDGPVRPAGGLDGPSGGP